MFRLNGKVTRVVDRDRVVVRRAPRRSTISARLTTLEEAARVIGGAHPNTVKIERALRDARTLASEPAKQRNNEDKLKHDS